MLKNHTPISKDENLAGESLFTNDNPIGLKQSSPVVCMKYKPTIHIMLTFCPGAKPCTPTEIYKKPSDSKNKPTACLVGEAGSLLRLPNAPHNILNNGANITINTGLQD